mgnify:FL=1
MQNKALTPKNYFWDCFIDMFNLYLLFITKSADREVLNLVFCQSATKPALVIRSYSAFDIIHDSLDSMHVHFFPFIAWEIGFITNCGLNRFREEFATKTLKQNLELESFYRKSPSIRWQNVPTVTVAIIELQNPTPHISRKLFKSVNTKIGNLYRDT